MRRIELSPEQQTQVRNLHAQGVTAHEIGRAFGLSKNPILRFMRDTGLKRTCQGCNRVLPGKLRKICRTCCPTGADYGRFRNYGIVRSDFERMLEAQNNLCALCPAPLDENELMCISVDHDHVTGRVRGLLCLYCNRILGPLEARAGWLERAAEYVKQR